jgi:hypothetical protein
VMTCCGASVVIGEVSAKVPMKEKHGSADLFRCRERGGAASDAVQHAVQVSLAQE